MCGEEMRKREESRMMPRFLAQAAGRPLPGWGDGEESQLAAMNSGTDMRSRDRCDPALGRKCDLGSYPAMKAMRPDKITKGAYAVWSKLVRMTHPFNRRISLFPKLYKQGGMIKRAKGSFDNDLFFKQPLREKQNQGSKFKF